MKNERYTPASASADTILGETAVLEEQDGRTFDSSPIVRDQRKSYRYPAQPGRDEAALRHGKRVAACKLREESAGGIAIKLPPKFRLNVDDVVEVGLYSGWYRARVVHVQARERGDYVGLERIAAILTGDDGEPAKRKRRKEPLEVLRKVLITLVVAISAIGAVGGAANWITGGKLNWMSSSSRTPPLRFSPIDDQLAGVLDSVNLLKQPEVAQHLRLSREQQATLDGIFVGTSNRLRAIHEDTKNQPPEVWYRQSQAVVNETLENVLCSLTDEQVLQWRTILLHKRQLQSRG